LVLSRVAYYLLFHAQLFQEQFADTGGLEDHANQVHQVNKAGLERLLVLVEGCHWLNRGRQEPPTGLRTPNKEVACTEATRDAESAAAAQDADAAESPPMIGAFSERHVYKYRCGQCSLAFRSQDKLELHAQYHQIRNTTRCRLCERNFRSVQALLKHVETGHTEQTEETARYRLSLMTHPLLMAGQFDRRPNGQNHGEEEDGMQENENAVANHEEESEECRVEGEDEKKSGCKDAIDVSAHLQQSNEVGGNAVSGGLGNGRALPYSLDKFLDPKRPFKCDICKESFTQKNILLVHFNSVSHLHKVKKIMTGSMVTASCNNNLLLTPQSEKGSGSSPTSNSSPNNSTMGLGSTLLSVLGNLNARKQLLEPEADTEAKLFKCNICQVAFSQASTLDIHIRSVVHRNRASRLQDLVLTGQVDLTRPLIEQPGDQEAAAMESILSSPKSLSSSLLEQQKTPPLNHQQMENSLEKGLCQPLVSSTPKSLIDMLDKSASGGRLEAGSSSSGILQESFSSGSKAHQNSSASPSEISSGEP